VTTWVAALMDENGMWTDEPGAAERLAASCDALMDAWTSTPADVVAVSHEVGLGVVPETRSGRLFRDTLGTVNQRLARTADEVWFVVAGLPQRLR
jgi:adenosylcobinamide kinase/adenosylcobinamide-phosphate guanylyltransferase